MANDYSYIFIISFPIFAREHLLMKTGEEREKSCVYVTVKPQVDAHVWWNDGNQDTERWEGAQVVTMDT